MTIEELRSDFERWVHQEYSSPELILKPGDGAWGYAAPRTNELMDAFRAGVRSQVFPDF